MRQYPKLWRMRILLPIWLLQAIAAVVVLAAGSIALRAESLLKNLDDGSLDYSSSEIDYASDAFRLRGLILIVFAAVTLLLDVVEAILAACHVLSPLLLLVSQCVKLPIWSCFLILTFMGIAHGASAWTVIIALVLFFTTFTALIYASTMVHRKRKGLLDNGAYAQAAAGSGRNMNGVPSQYEQHEMYPTGHGIVGKPSPTPPGYGNGGEWFGSQGASGRSDGRYYGA